MIPAHRSVSAYRLAAFLLLTSVGGYTAAAQTWYLDPNHSSAQFAVKHMTISTVRGAFTKVNGVVTDAPNPAQSSVEVEIDANSIDTRVEMRDKDLRSDHWFDTAKYPTITFKSKKVESAGAGKLKVTGDLTIHGVTKTAVLDVDGPSEAVKDPRGTSHRGVSATTTINRSEFGMTGGTGMVGDAISIQIDAEMVDKKPGPPPGGAPKQ